LAKDDLFVRVFFPNWDLSQNFFHDMIYIIIINLFGRRELRWAGVGFQRPILHVIERKITGALFFVNCFGVAVFL
jgi:hypothetical protein